MICQKCLFLEICGSESAELVEPLIWQNCLYVEEHNVEERGSDLAELSVCGQCACDLAELPVCGGTCQ